MSQQSTPQTLKGLNEIEKSWINYQLQSQSNQICSDVVFESKVTDIDLKLMIHNNCIQKFQKLNVSI